MSFISYLSMQIERFAFVINDIIIYFIPFLEPYLANHPETIMIVIGFGGQALFATRFIIQWLSSEMQVVQLYQLPFGIFLLLVGWFY